MKLSFLSAFLPAVVGIICFKKLPKALKILSAFAFISLALELGGFYLRSLHINNLFLFHAFTLIELILLTLVFTKIFNQKIITQSIFFAIILFTGFVIMNVILWEPLHEFNSNARAIEGIIIIALCIYFFFDLFVKTEVVNIAAYPYFWLVSGLLIYFSGTLFLYLFAKQIVQTTDVTYWIIHSVLNIFLNLIFSITLWLGRKWT